MNIAHYIFSFCEIFSSEKMTMFQFYLNDTANTFSGIVIALIHDDGEIGSVWKKFMEEMFTIDLPENFRFVICYVYKQIIIVLNRKPKYLKCCNKV